MGSGEEICSSQTDEVDSLSSDQENDEAQKDARDTCVGKVPVGVYHVGHAENVELLLTAAACCIDWEQDGPGNATADQRHDDEDFEETEPKISVERVVSKDMAVREVRIISY